MKKKISLAIIILIILASGVAFGLQKFGVVDLKGMAVKKAKTIPVVKEVIASKDIQKALQKKINASKDKLQELQKNNQSLKSKLQSKESELETKLEELKSLKQKLNNLQVKKEKEANKVKNLVDIYEAMSSQKAGEVIVELNDELATKLLKRLDSEKAGEILNQLSPEDAAKYSELLSN